MRELSGYRLTEALREDGELLLYRGWTEDGSVPVLLVSCPVDHPAPATQARLEREWSLRDKLDPAWSARPRALVNHQGRLSLALEDPGGAPLSRFISAPMDPGRFLRIALGLAAAVGGVHLRGLIHRDIKPTNILVDDADGRVHLTSFGIASELRRERQSPQPPALIEGTLAYMSPEQTGRMNRAVDYRTDFYSLGVVFYEMLTGARPFAGHDPMEWVHAHVAMAPRPPVEVHGEIPAVLSALVMKLLQKDPAARYQTARCLQADLERCRERWQGDRRIAPFCLGLSDVSDRFALPQKLYGREREVTLLQESFQRVVASGRSELVLVSGYSGIGKTSLVNELQKPIVQARSVFASGRFDQYKQGVPYHSLAQAVQDLVHALLLETEDRLAWWRHRLQQALGVNGQLMVDFVPQLGVIIGSQPPVAELPPTGAQNRFHETFRQFLASFAQDGHPLALFLDDLQWLDSGSLKLIQHVMTHPDTRHLFVVCAYRDNEVSPSHPLMLMLEEVRQAQVVIHELVLAPLSVTHLEHLIADTLHCRQEEARPLAILVHQKTAGNPYFASQFLTTLHDEGLIRFDTPSATWSWDVEQIRSRGFTDNVVELMVEKLRRLPGESQDVLQVAACIGSQFDAPILSLIRDRGEEEIARLLWPAACEELIVHSGEGWAFSHARIQQAAYALIPAERRQEVHLQIGRLLLARAARVNGIDFAIATQFNLGSSLLADGRERELVAGINLAAGRRAKSSTAFAAAAGYFASGMALLSADSWTTCYDLTCALHRERAECELASGNLAMTEQLLEAVLASARNVLDKVPAYLLRFNLCYATGEPERAIRAGAECLGLLGVTLPTSPSRQQVMHAYDAIWEHLGDRPIESLPDLPAMADPAREAALHVLSAMPPTASWKDWNLFCLTICHVVKLCLQHGNAAGAATGYATFGMILGPAFGRYEDGYRFGKMACDLAERPENLAEKPHVHYVFGFMTSHWKRHVRACLDDLQVSYDTALTTGDVVFACSACVGTISLLLTTGMPLAQVHRELEWRLDFVGRSRFKGVADVVVADQCLVRCLRGATDHFATFDAPGFRQDAFESQLDANRLSVAIWWYYVRKLQARFMSGDYTEALEAARRVEPFLSLTPIYLGAVEYHTYTALSLAVLHGTALPDEREGILQKLALHQEQLRTWADHCPENFGHRHALISAEIARLRGQDPEAMRWYEQAIRSARAGGFVHNEGVGNELAARFYQERGFETIAHAYLREARQCYVHWGADAKVAQLEGLHPFLREHGALSFGSTVGAPTEHLDIIAIARVSQAISREIVLSNLLEILMRTMVQQAGAEKGCMILARAQGDPYYVAAEARTSPAGVEVVLEPTSATGDVLPKSVLHYVMRTRERVILDDAAVPNLFSDDEYLRRVSPRSVLCIPLELQARLVGMLYLENNLAPRVFSAQRVTVLDLLASQAAISLENARLYTDLAEEQARLRAVFQGVPAGLIIAEAPSGRLIVANAQVERILRQPFRAVASSEEYREYVGFHPDGRRYEPQEWPLARSIANGETVEGEEVEMLRGDGTRGWVNLSSTPIRDAAGRIAAGVVILLDVTERRLAELALARLNAELEDRVHDRTARLEAANDELRRAKEAAEAANRAKSDFLSRMSHELRTPLNAILGYAQILHRGHNLDATQRQQLEILQSSGQHLLKLIIDVLDVGRIEAEKMDLVEAPFALPAFLRLIYHTTRLAADRKDLPLHFETPANLPQYVRGDERKLKQVLLNLLHNAIKYTPRGQVIFRARYDATGSGRLRCEVEDTGVGIPEDKLDAIFEPFTQLSTAAQAQEGTGLGLTITRRLVALMNGNLGLESNVDQGSTFWIEVPLPALSMVDPAAEVEDLGIVGYRGERRRIVVADDVTTNAQMLLALLGPLGFEVDIADNGRTAIQAALVARPALIVMDLAMPEMNGYEATLEIRRHPDLKDIRILGVSASISDSDLKDAFIANCDDFIGKPISVDLFLEKIRALLGLEWETRPLPPARAWSDESAEFTAVLALTAGELAEIEDLARLGDMRQIQEWATRLEAGEARHAPLARKLRELAGGYRTRAILKLVEQLTPKGEDSA